MRIGEHGLIDHLRLLRPMFVFIAAVWLLRIFLDLAGASGTLVNAASVTGAAALAVLISVLLIHVKRFGSYASVVLVSFLNVVWGQVLVVLAIAFSVLTHTENIFTAPEYSMPAQDPYHLHHILGHLTLVLGAGTLFGAAVGCFLLWVLRVLVPTRSRP